MKKIIIALILVSIGIGAEAQIEGNDYSIIKKFEAPKKGETIKFSFQENEKILVEYALMLGKSGVVQLVNTKNKKVIEIYKQARRPLTQNNIDCNKEEKNQIDYFNSFTLPTIQRKANKICSPIRWCYPVYCQGKILEYIMVLVYPNSIKCTPKINYKEEINRYKFY